MELDPLSESILLDGARSVPEQDRDAYFAMMADELRDIPAIKPFRVRAARNAACRTIWRQ